jgi:ubiquinone/menaquinone biosynthesis C-methylase UbiE
MNSSLENAINNEKEFFNSLNYSRRQSQDVPPEFDYDYSPLKFDFERYTSKIMGRKSVGIYLSVIKEIKGGKVIDVCCGPGWVSLLGAKNGASVSGYDISDVAIGNANEMKSKNLEQINKSNGSLEYHNHSVHSIPFLDQKESVNLYIGWSAFHHLDEMDIFFERMKFSLKNGGYIISIDDIGSNKSNRVITWMLKFLLPIKGLSYSTKISNLGRYFKKLVQPEVEWHTPMEEFVGKHENAAQKIEDILQSEFEIVHNYRYCAFIHYFVYDIAGPNWFRKAVFDILWPIDKFCVWSGICKGNLRFILAKKANEII